MVILAPFAHQALAQVFEPEALGPRQSGSADFGPRTSGPVDLGPRISGPVDLGPGRPFLSVAVDIKPGSDPNSINRKSMGRIPVAILSTPEFSAPEKVDRTSLTFGRTGNEQSLSFCNKSAEDVNGDSLLDLVCHFETQKTGFQNGDTEGILRGKTVEGISIEGRDSVKIVS